MSGAEQRLLLQNLPGENTVGPLPRFLGEGPNGVSIKFLRLSATGRPPEDEGFSLSRMRSLKRTTQSMAASAGTAMNSAWQFSVSRFLLIKACGTLLQKCRDALLVAS